MESWGDLAKQLWWEMTPQTNYHGTPKTFNKFDDSKFLTGEGAMAHGAGHYSADLLNTAKDYRGDSDWILKYNGNIFYTKEYPHLIDDIDYYKSLKIDNNINELNRIRNQFIDHLDTYNHWLDNYDDIPLKDRALDIKKSNIIDLINSAETRIHALDNLDRYNIEKVQGGNLYKVNVPNKNFMLDVSKPFDEQSKYIKEAIYKMFKGNDISEGVKDLWMGLNRFEQNDTRYIYNWLAEDIGDKMSEELHWADWNTQRKAGAPKASKIFDKYGIKGIRAVGRQDGGINVTFTGKNIKMANTIPQQIRNRIPVETLGKMARKLYNYPVVKGGIKFLDMFGPSLMVPDVIKLTHPQLYPYTNKEKQNMKNILERKYGIKINGNRITL